jgi:DNA-binding beta-propeller fold protein YncE
LSWHRVRIRRRPTALSGLGRMALVTGILLCVSPALGTQTAFAGKKALAPADVGYIFTKNLQTGAGELVQFDNRTNTVLRRILEPATSAPELLMSPQGQDLFMLGSHFSGKTQINTVAVLDALSDTTLSTFSVPKRVLYVGPGPDTMALSPSGLTLYVYSYSVPKVGGGSYARYWLTAVHLDTHTVSTKRIDLSGCGSAYFATAKRWIVVLCNDSSDVRFVDPLKFKVVARTHLPSWLGPGAAALDVPRSQDRLYIVTVDLRIVVIDTNTHRLLGSVTGYRQDSGAVSGLYSTAITSDDRELIVGSMAKPHDTSSPFTLHGFYLPSFKPAKTVTLQRFMHFVAAPNGGLYVFPMGDSPDNDWRVRYLNSDLTMSSTSIQLSGPAFQLAIPSDALSSSG